MGEREELSNWLNDDKRRKVWIYNYRIERKYLPHMNNNPNKTDIQACSVWV